MNTFNASQIEIAELLNTFSNLQLEIVELLYELSLTDNTALFADKKALLQKQLSEKQEELTSKHTL